MERKVYFRYPTFSLQFSEYISASHRHAPKSSMFPLYEISREMRALLIYINNIPANIYYNKQSKQ